MSARRRLVPVVAVLAALGLGELGARVVAARLVWRPLPPFGHGKPQHDWLERSERELAAGREGPGYTRFDPELGWSPKPGHVSPDGSVHVNAAGLRSTREYTGEVPPGVRRLIACGESFTFCEEVSDADAWSARLEALGEGFEVLNLGVGGYGTDQALLRARRDARGPAEALLVGLMIENIGRNVNRYRPLWHPLSQPAAKPRFVLGASGLELVPQPFASRAEFVAAVRDESVFARLAEHEGWSDGAPPSVLRGSMLANLAWGWRAYAVRDLHELWSDTAGEPFRVTVALLEAFRDLLPRLECQRLVVLVFPPRFELEHRLSGGDPYWHPLRGELERLGIETLDLFEALADAARAEGVAALYRESHLSPRGNELVARSIAALLPHDPPPRVPK